MEKEHKANIKEETSPATDKTKKRRKPRVWLIVTLSILGVFAIFALMIYFSFAGNPITRIVATRDMRAYAKDSFDDYSVGFAIYDFKLGYYCCNAENPDIPDSDFTIRWREGKISDDYGDRVTGRWNTYIRIESDLDDIVSPVVEAEYPHKTRLVMANFNKGEYDPELLSLGMEIDPKEPPLETSLVLWCETEFNEPSWEELAEDMLEAKALMEKKGFDIDYYSISLEYPYNEDGDPEKYESLGVFDIPAGDVTNDGTLAERLQKASEEFDAAGK